MISKLLLFDFDGVLVDSLAVYARAIQWTLEKIDRPLVKSEADYLDLFDDNFYAALEQRGVDLDVFARALQDYTDMMGAGHYADVRPFAFMSPILDALCKDHVLGIISSNSMDTIEEILARHQHRDCFQTILGSDFALSKKDKILYALDKFQAVPENTYYIGDTAGDVVEGKRAGVKTVAVTWGWHPKERLAAVGPDYLLDSPEMLLRL